MNTKNNNLLNKSLCGRKIRNLYGFTLVELIVVITILTILGTIGFTQMQGYSSSARDSSRIENLSNLQKGLTIFQVKSGVYPMPENPVNITASGVTIGYQGFAKDVVGGIAKLSPGGTKDPLDSSIYTTYSVNSNQTKMQLMSFLEDGSSISAFIPTAYAGTGTDYSKRYPLTRGDTLGILLGNTGGSLNQPVQESGIGVDIFSGNTALASQFNAKKPIAIGNINTMFVNYYKYQPQLFSIKPNLLTNGGFENDMTDWGFNTNTDGGLYGEILSASAYSGIKTYHTTRMVTPGLTPSYLSDQYTNSFAYFGGANIAGRMFRVSCMVKTNGMDSGSRGVYLANYWANSSGWVWNNNNVSDWTKETSWKEISAVGVAPVGSTYAYVLIAPDPNRTNTNGEYWLDNCKIEEVLLK